MNYIGITKQNLHLYADKYDVLICQMRTSRNKAKQLAVLEMSTVLSEADGIFIQNGPLGDVKGLFSFFIKKNCNHRLKQILRTTGYCNKFYMLDFTLQNPDIADDIKSMNPLIWKGLKFNIIHFYLQSEEEYKEKSSHNRVFAIYQSDNTVKYVRGYRGDGSEAGRRGLPLEDARLMVNLAEPYRIKKLLDPFAGGGGIIHAARDINNTLYRISIDIDRTLEPGLRIYSDKHYICDSREADILEKPVDAIVTEVPFSANYSETIIQVFYHLSEAVSESGKILCMCHIDQFPAIKAAWLHMGYYLLIGKEVNRKGTPVVVSLLSRDTAYYKRTKDYYDMLQKIR